MAGGAVAESSSKKKGKGGRRKKRRIHIRIDMTPMVDIVMLLLIFYMVTTVFSMPQAMEINLPPEEETEEVAVKESRLLTIRIDGENRFFWNIGDPAKNIPQLLPSSRLPGDTLGYKVDTDSLRSLLRTLNYDIPKLNTLIMIREDAKYEAWVDILDEIDLLERSWNAAKAKELEIKVEDLDKPEYKENKFSYRYAMGEWEDRDDRIVALISARRRLSQSRNRRCRWPSPTGRRQKSVSRNRWPTMKWLMTMSLSLRRTSWPRSWPLILTRRLKMPAERSWLTFPMRNICPLLTSLSRSKYRPR